MEVVFRTRKLEREYREYAKATRSYGHDVARRYIERINIIKHARDIHELKALPSLNCHQLKGKRREQYGISLTGYYRLIISLKGNELEIVQIEEVSKHYGD